MNSIDINNNLDNIKAKAEDIRNLLLTTSTGSWEDILGHFVVLSGEYGSLVREINGILESITVFPDQITNGMNPHMVPELLRTKLSPELENKTREIINQYVNNNLATYDLNIRDNTIQLDQHINSFNDKMKKVDQEFENKIQQISKHKLIKPSASHDTAILKDILSITMLGSGIKINAQQQQQLQQQQQATLNALQQQRLLNAQQQQQLFNITNPQQSKQQQQQQQQAQIVQVQNNTPSSTIVINSPSPGGIQHQQQQHHQPSPIQQQQKQTYNQASPNIATNKTSPPIQYTQQVVNSPPINYNKMAAAVPTTVVSPVVNKPPAMPTTNTINKQQAGVGVAGTSIVQPQQSIVQMVQNVLPTTTTPISNIASPVNQQFKPVANTTTNATVATTLTSTPNANSGTSTIQQQIQQQQLLQQQLQQAAQQQQFLQQQALLQQQQAQQQQQQQHQVQNQFHNFQPNNFRPN